LGSPVFEVLYWSAAVALSLLAGSTMAILWGAKRMLLPAWIWGLIAATLFGAALMIRSLIDSGDRGVLAAAALFFLSTGTLLGWALVSRAR